MESISFQLVGSMPAMGPGRATLAQKARRCPKIKFLAEMGCPLGIHSSGAAGPSLLGGRWSVAAGFFGSVKVRLECLCKT